MITKFLGLCQAALLAGMTGFAPYLAGRTVLPCAAMPGMAVSAPAAAGQGTGPMSAHDAMAMPDDAPAPPSGLPKSHHAHDCCANCLGPCAAGASLALPATAAAAGLALPSPAGRPAVGADPFVPTSRDRLLPFANGPPSHLG